jgi:hypothetical protein
VTDRLYALLARLGLLLLAAALAAPLAWGAAQAVIHRPDLQWTTVNQFWRPVFMAYELQADYSFGFTLILKNRGDAPSGPARVVLRMPPRHFDVLDRPLDGYTTTPIITEPLGEEGLAIDLGPLEAGERVAIVFYEVTELDVDVLENGEPLHRLQDDVSAFDQRLHLPRWAGLAGALLLTGLALQTLALRRAMRAQPR